MFKLPLSAVLLGLSACLWAHRGFAQSISLGKKRINHGFIENKGQIRDQKGKPNQVVKYLLPLSSGLNLELNANSFSYDTYTAKHIDSGSIKSATNHRRRPSSRLEFKFHRVDVSLDGANAHPEITAIGPSSHRYNYPGISHDGKKNISAREYDSIVYKDIYPSIDLVFIHQVKDSNIIPEYHFVVHPGGDATQIKLHYNGALNTKLFNNRIELDVSKGKINESIPLSYCMDKGVKTTVPVKYRKTGKDTYGFSLPHYDGKKVLIIDPTPDLVWGTYYGGEYDEWAYSIAKDSYGNIFMGGATQDANGIATSGAYQSTFMAYQDVMLGKFTSNGALVWMTYYGGAGANECNSIAVDKMNNIVVAGSTSATTNIATPGAFLTAAPGSGNTGNAFLAKFDNEGVLLWGTYYGGGLSEVFYGVAIDSNNNIIAGGTSCSFTGVATPNTYQPTNYNNPSSYTPTPLLVKFDENGNRIWGTYYGGKGGGGISALAIDKAGNIFATGGSTATERITTPGCYQNSLSENNIGSIFISKFSGDGLLKWGTYYGLGGQGGYGYCITIDQLSNVYVGGETTCTSNIATAGAIQMSCGDQGGLFGDGFIAKLDSNGALKWGTYCGGYTNDFLTGIYCNGSDALWCTGAFGSLTPFITQGAYQSTFPGTPSGIGTGCDVFVVKLSVNGQLQWGTFYGYTPGQPNGSQGYGVVSDAANNVYVTGMSNATKNVSTCGAVQPALGSGPDLQGAFDAFLGKFADNPSSAAPSITIKSEDATLICPDSTVTFSADVQNDQNGASFQWLLNGQPVGGDSSSFVTNKLTTGDSIRCILYPESGCSMDSASSNTINAVVDSAIAPTISIAGSSGTICQGTVTTFVASASHAGSNPSYQWMVNGVAAGTDSLEFSTSQLLNGENISCTIVHRESCIADSTAESNIININVLPTPSPSIKVSASANPICPGTPVTFVSEVTGGGANPSYTWKIGNETVGTDSASYSSANIKDGDSVYCILGPVTDGGCSSEPAHSDTVREILLPLPQISISGDTIISKGGSTQISVVANGAITSYQWSPDSTLSNSSTSNPIASPSSTTTYTVEVKSPEGCEEEKSVVVTVISKISIPSGFTPNGDGKNDLFNPIYGSDITDVHFSIFNRWGQLLFQDFGSHKGWDGNVNGSPQPEGAYVWIFSYKSARGQMVTLKGTLALMR